MKLCVRRLVFVLLLLLVALFNPATQAQTFRGGIAGTVVDSSGAVVPNAKLSIVSLDTGFTRVSQSTSSGDFAFQDLPLGHYSLTVDAEGFARNKVDNIVLRPGQIYSLNVQLKIASSSQEVVVNAAAVALDTQSSTNNAVVNDTAVQNIPLNGRDFTQLLKTSPGYNGSGSLNGARTNQMNWQIDGADNNDLWQNTDAANQGGVAGIAGVLIPVEAIDQFTVQTEAGAEMGRNGGGLISLAIKSGTNSLHGSAYYFNRNEFFAEKSDFLPSTTRKPELRNQQFGSSIGGPIRKNRLFYFLNYERQMYVIQNQALATEPTQAYISAAEAVLSANNVPVDPLSLNVLSLWPEADQAVGPASSGNFYDSQPQKGYSDNTILKLDYTISGTQSLSIRGFVGLGQQYAATATNIFNYYQVAPDHTQNYMIVHNWAITPHLTNQALFGYGVFDQTFNDADHSQDMPAIGLNTGVTNPSLFGAPTITIDGGIDEVGDTQPLGRLDITGHFTDTATYLFGKHQVRFGGELRRSYMNLLYQPGVRGTFLFTGTATDYALTGFVQPQGTPYYQTCGTTAICALADYLAGYVANSSIVQGSLQRNIYENSFDLFAQDQYQATPNFTLNYGARYTYNGPFSSTGVLSDFRPTASQANAFGLVLANQVGGAYPRDWANLAPRFGFAYHATPKTVIRGTYGVYFDVPNLNGFFDNSLKNGATIGVQANPIGSTPVETLSRNYYEWTLNVDPFTSATAPPTQGLSTIGPNFRTAYIQNFNLNTEYQINHNTLLQIGYVGSLGRRLFGLYDINQAAPGPGNSTAVELTRRPYYTDTSILNHAILTGIDEFDSEGHSNYNSLQVMLRTSSYHGLTAQGGYTYGHALDTVSTTRGVAPQYTPDSAAEYGNSSFDNKHTFNAYAVYQVPNFTTRMPWLSAGWQGNAFITYFTGTPINVTVGTDNSGTGEFEDRMSQIANPSAGVSRRLTVLTPGSAPVYPWYNTAAFVVPAQGTFGNMARDSLRGPNFFTTDASLVKNTRLNERLTFQLRAECFNIFNYLNLANPTASHSSGTFMESTATRNSSSAPGIGPGEPFNVQFAGKFIF
jgi:Carboxypeptidase regulatory-like domain/TonB dependent receptor